MSPPPPPPFGLFKSRRKEDLDLEAHPYPEHFYPEDEIAANREAHSQGEDYDFPQGEEFYPTLPQDPAGHHFTQEHAFQSDPGAAIVYQPSERTGSQPASPTGSSSFRPSKRSQRSPVKLAGTPEVAVGNTPHSLSPHSDPGTFPGSQRGSDHPPSAHHVYLNPAPPTAISLDDAPSVTPTSSPPPPPPKAKGSLKKLLIPSWSRTSLPETRDMVPETHGPTQLMRGPSVEPVPVTQHIQPKRKGSLVERIFRNRSRSSVQEPEDPEEVVSSPLQRKGSFGLFRSRSRTATAGTENAPSIHSRTESPTPQSAGSKKRFGLFRKSSRDAPATPLVGQTLEATGSPVFLRDAPTQSSFDDGASVGSQKRSRNPFNIFRKKSTASTAEESQYKRAGFPPQGDPGAPSPDVLEGGDVPFRPNPKRTWSDKMLSRSKPPKVAFDPVLHEEPEEMFLDDFPPASPPVERQHLSIEPASQAGQADYPATSSAGDRPPPVVDLVTPTRSATPPYHSLRATNPDEVEQPTPVRTHRPTSPQSILQRSATRRPEAPGITHVLEAPRPSEAPRSPEAPRPPEVPRSPVGPAYHVYPYAGSASQDPMVATPANPVHVGNWRVSIRGNEDTQQLAQSYPYNDPDSLTQYVGGQAPTKMRKAQAPTQTKSAQTPTRTNKIQSGAQVMLQHGQEYELPADGNVILIAEDDMNLEIKDPVTGQFVPYDEGYIAKQAVNKRTPHEDTYYIPPGKTLEFQDEEGNVLHRSSENDRYGGIHDLGNGIRGGYDADGSYVLHLNGDGVVASGSHHRASAKPPGSSRPPPTHASPNDRLYENGTDGYQRLASDYHPSLAPLSPPESYRHPSSPPVGSYRPANSSPPRSYRPTDSSPPGSIHSDASPQYAPTYDTHESANIIQSPSQSLQPHGSGRSSTSRMSFPMTAELIQGLQMLLKKNEHWKPHGPKDYARSVRKYHIGHSHYCPIFSHEGALYHRNKPPASDGQFPEQDGAGAPPSGVQGAQLSATDVQNDQEYVVPVVIGTPGQTVRLDFDTGSSDLWVWSSELHSNSTSHRVYDPRASSTARQLPGLTWKISYGDGSSASGTVCSDVLKFNKLTIPNQSIEIADYLSSAFLSETGSDGLFGLAFPTLNTVKPQPQKTPVEQLIEQKIIDQPIFCAKLDKGGTGSYYTFGYIPQDVLGKYNHISYVDVDSSRGFWEFPSLQLRVGSHTCNRQQGNTAIADTGTTLILLDDPALNEIYGRIQGARVDHSGWTLPSNANCPDIAFSVGGKFFAISGEDLKFADAGNGMSFGAIQSRGSNRQDILGDVFLKRVLAVFDQTPGHPRIGFGQRDFNETSTSSSRRGR